MKWQRFFLLLFLVPILMYGLSQEECTHIYNQIALEWKKHNEFIEQYKRVGPNEGEKALQLLKESLECCKRALIRCDTILNDIANKSKSKRKKPWRVRLKSLSEQDKHSLKAEINVIQPIIQQFEGNLAANKADIVYQRAAEKATLANAKNGACKRRLDNIDEVVTALNEIVQLYEEAATIAREALILIAPYSSQSQNQSTLKQVIETYQGLSQKYKKEAASWPASVAAQKNMLKEQIATLKEDRKLFIEKGLTRSSYELQKQAAAILEQLIERSLDEETEGFKKELAQLKASIDGFEKEADSRRLTEPLPFLSPEEFRARENQRRKAFFKNDLILKPAAFFQACLHIGSRPLAIPLDGQIGKSSREFNLYTDQFYRFLIQSDTPVSHLLVKVSTQGAIVHEEKIALPLKNTTHWERYLTTDGMIFIPETKIQAAFGIDLRMNFVCDSKCKFSMIIAQKATQPGYQISVSLDEGNSLYECHLSSPPPWQLGVLRKPTLPNANRSIDKTPSSPPLTDKNPSEGQQTLLELMSFPVLDKLVEELKKEPLLLAQYVQHEIALVDPFLREENGIFQAPGIHRDPGTTYLEKAGSPWEQCQLLVYLLRKAGYQANYVMGDPCSLPKTFVEKMLFTCLPEGQEEALLQYPWVVFSDGKETVSLFPWMKDIQVTVGYDLYNFMPAEYASADRWILRYLKGDERILKYIGSDGDDTAAVLFSRFAEEELRKQGLSLADVGIHRTPLKKQFASWADFPRPTIKGTHQIFDSLSHLSGIFALAIVKIFSHENPKKQISCVLPLVSLNCSTIPIRFSLLKDNKHRLCVQFIGTSRENYLDLDETDISVDVKVSYSVPIGSDGFHAIEHLSIAKGTSAALCFHFGGTSSQKTSHFYEKFSSEKDEQKRLHALLSFVGASYFEKCGRAEELLASLHKVIPATVFAFGLAKLSPDTLRGVFTGDQDLTLPQVDMFWFRSQPTLNSHPSAWNQETATARMQFDALVTVDSSSNEHQILREVFKDPYAISTVKLLQIAHLEQQKKGLEGEGFLIFTSSSFEAANNTPEAAKSLYFSHLKDLNLRDVKTAASGQWEVINSLLDPGKPNSCWAYAYMTPGLTLSQGGAYKEMGALILYPHTQYALISNNNLVSHGGLGSPLPPSYFTPYAMSQWQLVKAETGYTLEFPSHFSYAPNHNPLPTPSIDQPLPEKTTWSADVRPWYKVAWSHVADPVDVVSGAFYVEETDLVLPGPFSLNIRRNYNSQNPLIGHLGCGWKLSINPFLIEQDGKRFVAELDGTVIVYRYNQIASRWEVFPEDNPGLFNFSQKGVGSCANPFHAYIENDVLYGTDGSKRFFEDSLLKKWVDARGNSLTFFYDNEQLSRIESSNGDFCGLHYNHEGRISEIYAKDGRRISYNYNSQGDLIKVILPNTAVITYEYDRNHRIIRETKPHGKVLENKYDDEGRVKEQKSPMGHEQEMTITAAFEYGDNVTTVTDAGGGKTIYKIFENQIYKVIDPLGFSTLQSWFIDETSWFDPETEQVVSWNKKGGAIRSLKSTTDKRGLMAYYFYDSRGNPEIIGLEGKDLTGNGKSKLSKKFAYNELNLCTEEESCGQRILIIYDSNFPYLTKRTEKYSENVLIGYTDFEYDPLGQLVKEDHSGSVTIWRYDDRGFPHEKIQMTGTDDPDVVTTYAYNHQGQCIKIKTIDGIQENDYDLMGNQIQSKTFDLSGELLSAAYIGYDLNCAPIWKQTANAENIVYLDYHASGLVKAKRQSLYPSRFTAYTLYEYDPRGYLTEETDPRGYVTYRDYDALGRIKAETKEGHTTRFTYEPGGFVGSIMSPSGAQTTRQYTTNGLLKEEIYPDGTKSSVIYDFLGRPVLESKNDVIWEIQYDDANHRVIRTHVKTKIEEISEFDQRGNLVRFTDAAGYTTEKSYDGLNRVKTEISPSGKQTVWSYQGNLVARILPNDEIIRVQYVGGQAAASDVVDSQGIPIATSRFHFDPENEREEIIEGDTIAITWKNSLGLPVKIEKGGVITTYEYDACGNCLVSIDGDGRVIRQKFDGLGRRIQKELADGTIIEFRYDLDSNLTEYHLPNGNIWKASYDVMRRKRSEELISSRGGSSGCWNFFYENGYLVQATDPMQRTHTYLYDSYGRLTQDVVEGGKRTYTYDPRGFLATVDQTTEIGYSGLFSWLYGAQNECSLVKRSYDADGNLSLESIYLDGALIQQTQQEWTAARRSLQIGSHVRDFIYQNNRLVQISTQNVELAYSYGLDGSLKSKHNPLISTTIESNASGLPEIISTHLPEGAYREQLDWYPSGKLYTYTAPGNQQSFSYNERGYLKSAGDEQYDFDFGSMGTGIRTASLGWYIPQNGLDDFGKILASVFETHTLSICYNAMGEVIAYGQRQLSWDPWGRLLKVNDPSFSWEASYDAFGRRLQTRYTKLGEQTLVTNSLYDPEEEFQEIGVQVEGKTFWKIYGPSTCDAISDETGASVILIHNALGQLTGVVSRQGTLFNDKFPSVYGPLEVTQAIPTDLISYAQSLNWHSKAQDPTGLIWMGDRYYDARSGRFLSQDSVSYPICLDLYVYANGDPINYIDPDGRFASHAYQTTKPVVIGAFQPFGLNLAMQGSNTFAAYLANHQATGSMTFEVGSFDLPNGEIGIINGINNMKWQSMESAWQLSQYAQGAKIYGTYNATNLRGIQPLSIGADVLECAMSHIGWHTPPVQLLKNRWARFIATHGPEAKYLQICHSGGADHVKNALLSSPESVRQRIIVLAIAPSVVIPKKLCYESTNYISRRDFVTHLDVWGKMKYGNELQILNPQPDTSFWDHEFLSPTFESVLQRHITDYIRNYGGKG